MTCLAILLVSLVPVRTVQSAGSDEIPDRPADTNQSSNDLYPLEESETSYRNSHSGDRFWQHPSVRLPDLRTLPPEDLKIVKLSAAVRQLRLSNTIWNSGAGPLELAGELDQESRRTIVRQHIYTDSDKSYIHPVGEFVWHPTHDHWHFEDFTVYELWSLTPNGEREALVSSSDKLSYCVIDTDPIDQRHPAFVPRRRYGGCGQRLQGLSAGWGDTYQSHLDGQSIDISQVADGIYALVSRTNPEEIVVEANPYNNSAVVYIEIKGNSISRIEPQELSEEFCRLNGRC